MIKYKQYLVNKKQKLLFALETLDKLTHKVLFITDDEGKLCGTITDGDLRRSIIRKDNNVNCQSLMNTKCII